jgi:TPP-dependent pyruvate/acetoin dehydrogenase alpha subunit
MEEFIINLYKIMLLIRKTEGKIAELYPEQEMRCPTHLCIGQEAVPAGVCENLKKEDVVFSNHRSHGHYLAKGGNLGAMLAEIYGRETGCAKGRGGSMHLIDVSVNFLGSTAIVCGTVPLAAGAAFASKLQNKNNVSVAFFGDAAVEEGTFSETLNFSSLHKLPVLFVCENNLYASQTHIRERQPNRPITKLAEGHNIRTYRVDGNDVIGIYETAKKAIAYIKAGNGPVFMECLTYRWKEHCGPNEDAHLGYREEKEILAWRQKDPLRKIKNMISAKNKMAEERIRRVEEEIDNQINDAVSFAKSSPFPKGSSLAAHVYPE